MKKLYLLLTLMVLATISASAVSYKLYGSWSDSSNWISLDMTESNGVWTISNVSVTNSSAQFGIKQVNDSNDQTGWYAAPSDGTTTISEAGDYSCATSNCTNFSISTGTWCFSFNPNTSVLIVSEGSLQDATITYALRGSWDGTWTDKAMTESDGTWTLSNVEVTNTAGSAEFGIQKLTNGVQTSWYWSTTSGTTISAAGDYSCGLQTEATTGGNFSISIGTWSFSFNPDTSVLIVTGTATEAQPTIYLVGTVNIWTIGSPIVLTGTAQSDGSVLFTYVVTSTSSIQFKLSTASDGTWDTFNDGVLGLSNTGNYTIATNTDYTLSANNTSNIEIAAGTYTLNVTLSGGTYTLRAVEGDTTGVESLNVADDNTPEYYNLQGVRVANPENGIFIMRCGNKVGKVVK